MTNVAADFQKMERIDLHFAAERGSNAKRADMDLQVQISGEETRTATIIKANDGPDGPLTAREKPLTPKEKLALEALIEVKHRAKVCVELGIELKVTDITWAYVKNLNQHRRSRRFSNEEKHPAAQTAAAAAFQGKCYV
jgi:hypothetical protein